ncbi:hypothetical protein GCM10009745_40770 [Kribbella yunnanensis]|uniref:Uncharacterized protein n=1 Tax=Kribbella yunnanensis TaxID=190194 RepID=A0ABN2HPK8_9ACTN
MAVIRIDPASEGYRQFVRLYETARSLRPSELDRWNGELYATVGEGKNWGSLRRDGSLQLSQELVLDHLGPDAAPQDQVQALTTILHEANHARVEIKAPEEPNAVLSSHSKALDEGLTEWVSVSDVAEYADRAGYGDLPDPKPAYPSAYGATEALLEYAAGPEGAADLADRTIDAPVTMRWDVIADEIVKNKLAGVVPQGPEHQQAARAELINAMTTSSWQGLDESRVDISGAVAAETDQALDQATQRIQNHYARRPETPYPANTPNFLIAKQQETSQKLDSSQERVVRRGDEVDLTNLPPPHAGSRVEGARRGTGPGSRERGERPATGRPSAGQSAGEPVSAGAGWRFLSGSAPAGEAVRHRPVLGNGARGAGASGGGRGGVERPVSPTDRGRG